MGRRTIGAMFACALLAGSWAAQAAQVSDMAPCAPNSPQRTTVLKSFLTVHVVCSNVQLEIPPEVFGRTILLYTEFAALSTGGSEYAPGSAVDTRAVRWFRIGAKVALISASYESHAGDSIALQQGVRAISLPTVIEVFDVIRETESGAPVIDVTALFTTNVPTGFALDFKRHYRMARVDGDRSVVREVRAFPENIAIGFYQTWVPEDSQLLKPTGEDVPPAGLGFFFTTNFLLLPEKPMQMRCRDTRVGYFYVPFDDYSTNENRVVSNAAITRYRLEKKDPKAAISDPVKPIVFYLSPEIPARWRPYIKKAVEDWAGPLEAAGFRNAIQARDAPTPQEDPLWDPGDLRYSVVRWAPGPRENALGPAVMDPRSGEVISSHTLVWHDVLRLVELWYLTQVGPLDPRAKKLPLPDDLEGELLRYAVAHEIGHALGLRHNFKGHSAYSVKQLRDPVFTHKYGNSASIMDYSRFNYVAQPGDGAYLLPKIGVYDYFAIDWGYRVIPGARDCAAEFSVLDKLASKQVDDPALRYGGENDSAKVDPLVNMQVLGSDPIEATDMGLRNADRVAAMLIPATTDLGKSYDQLNEAYQALLVKRSKQLGAVAKLIGGVEETRYHGGRGTVPFKPVAAERQRKAARFLVQRGFTEPDALLDPDILWRIAPYGGDDLLQQTNKELFEQIIDKDVFQRMAEAATLPNAKVAYQGGDMLEDLSAGLFSELKQPQPVITLYRRDTQRLYVSRLLSAFSGADAPSEFRVALRSALISLRDRLDKAEDKIRDPLTRAHIKDLKLAIGS